MHKPYLFYGIKIAIGELKAYTASFAKSYRRPGK
jgi:hypothetical protein